VHLGVRLDIAPNPTNLTKTLVLLAYIQTSQKLVFLRH